MPVSIVLRRVKQVGCSQWIGEEGKEVESENVLLTLPNHRVSSRTQSVCPHAQGTQENN